MKILRFQSRRRNEYAQLLETVERLESVVAKLAAEVAEAKRSARRADQSARAIRRNLDMHEEEDQSDGKPWRVCRLVGLCTILTLLAGLLTFTGAKGFANPLAAPSGTDSIGFAVQVESPSQLKSQSFPTYVSATYTEYHGDSAEYQVVVPAKYAGKRYVLMLPGTARIDQPSAGMLDNTPQFTSRSVTCTDPRINVPLPQTQQCQLISGRFPAEANIRMPTLASCQTGMNTLLPSLTPNAVMIDIVGSSHVAAASDWAYQQYSIPGVTNVGANVEGYLNSWSGIPLGGWYESSGTTACVVDELPKNAELTDTYEPATQSADGELIWSGSLVYSTAFVMRRRDADEMGNALLAGGAATAALAIGLIPIIYDANRERRSALKRQRQRSSQPPVLL